MPTRTEEKRPIQRAYLPIQRPELEEFRDVLRKSRWDTEEAFDDALTDRDDWDWLSKENPGACSFIEFNLAFFAEFDDLINENLMDNFRHEVGRYYNEAKRFYNTQADNEDEHNKTYSTIIETFIRDPVKKDKMLNSIENYPAIKTMADWTAQWMNPELPLLERIVAFACVEGILFQSSFASILWVAKLNRLKSLVKANEWIRRDEGLHAAFAVILYHVMTSIDHLFERLPQQRVHEIIKSCVDVIIVFIKDALPISLVSINAEDMISYIKCVSDALAEAFGYEKIYEVENKLDWMVVVGLPTKSNFFESKETSYSKMTCAIEKIVITDREFSYA